MSWRRLRWVPAFVTTSACAAPSHNPAGSGSSDLAFVHVAVVDAANQRVLPGQTVLIRGNRIAEVSPSGRVRIRAGTRVVDARGKFLIPGLWDMHTHVTWEGMPAWSFPLLIAHGVTGVREMGTHLEQLLLWRARTARGEVLGPRIVGAGPLLDGEPPARPRVAVVLRTPEEARRAVDSLAARGADFIKVYEMLQRDVFLAILEQSSAAGIPVAGHVPLAVDASEASDRGMRSFEHLRNLDLACSSASDSIRDAHARSLRDGAGRSGIELRTEIHRARRARVAATYDPERCTRLMQRLARNSTWLVPTLGVASIYLADPATVRYDRELLRFVPVALRSGWEEHVREAARRPPDLVRLQAEAYDGLRRLVALGRAGGVGILAGTDIAPVTPWMLPGASLHDELRLLTEAGLAPGEALQTVTIGPARFLGATDSLGAVAPGRLADLVLLGANPIEDIRNARRIHGVVLNGRYLDRPALDRLLREAESIAAH